MLPPSAFNVYRLDTLATLGIHFSSGAIVIRFSTMTRTWPNILVTGTPGVGKSTLCSQLAEQLNDLQWIEVGKLAKENNCYESFDETYQCPILHEDKVLDLMEDLMAEGGKIVDYHGCDFFPERWFDAVFVLRSTNTALYDRLSRRGYTSRKLEDNISCEIFGTILEEAMDSYKHDIVFELSSNNPVEMDNNVEHIIDWVRKWRQNKSTSMYMFRMRQLCVALSAVPTIEKWFYGQRVAAITVEYYL